MFLLEPFPHTHCLSSVITPTLWHVVTPDLQCSLPPIRRKLWIWVLLHIWLPSTAACRSCISLTDRTVETLLSSRKTSYARAINSDTTYDSYSKEKSDTDGPFAIAALAEYTGNDNGGQILVCSSALMMTDQLMQSSSLLNRSFLSNTISVMQPDTQLVSIASKSMAAEPLTLGTTATYVVFLILLFIPIFLFVYGLVVFFQRRRL